MQEKRPAPLTLIAVLAALAAIWHLFVYGWRAYSVIWIDWPPRQLWQDFPQDSLSFFLWFGLGICALAQHRWTLLFAVAVLVYDIVWLVLFARIYSEIPESEFKIFGQMLHMLSLLVRASIVEYTFQLWRKGVLA